ncbi:MAG TPA: transcriptional regulator [Candidatus Nanoarchaeia archaeon]|nr:transcriptional regulator [Candidatus Nanoarchaeia archaeon]
MIILPQEIEVWHVLPALRKGLVEELLKLGLRQKDAAEKLGLTAAAVSQYQHDKRGNIKFNPRIRKEIAVSAKKIIDGMPVMNEMIRLCKFVRESLTLCELHKIYDKNVPSSCDPQETGCIDMEEPLLQIK